MKKRVWLFVAVMALVTACYAGKITLVQDKDGYTGCYTEMYYNFDHWDKRYLFNMDWIGSPSFATNKSFAKNGQTKIGGVADYCC